METRHANDEQAWESFLCAQPWSPFLQSWTMGEVYRELGQEPVRLEIRKYENTKMQGEIVGICQAIVVPAKRGKHLSVPYGPVLKWKMNTEEWKMAVELLVEELKSVARKKGCGFIRMSPFIAMSDERSAISGWGQLGFRPSPLHMLAEHIWYMDLRGKSEEDLRKGMRATTRNLIGRAEREGVMVEVSNDPVRDLPHFLLLHEETRKRHGFTPYVDAFFLAQVEKFSRKGECALYLARSQGEVIAASIHMMYGGETSYHHGASSRKFSKLSASYLLQWRAIQDAMRRGDRVYNFWGIAPVQSMGNSKSETPARTIPFGSGERNPQHPFAGVTTFKTGFGGELLELMHCVDLPLSKKYWITFGIETVRKWRRGF